MNCGCCLDRGTYYDLNIDRSEADAADTGVADGDGAI